MPNCIGCRYMIDLQDNYAKLSRKVQCRITIPPAGGKDGQVAVRARHCPAEPVAAVPLIYGVGFGVFFQKIAEQVVVGVDVRVFFKTLGPVCLEGRLGLDVYKRQPTAYPGFPVNRPASSAGQWLGSVPYGGARLPALPLSLIHIYIGGKACQKVP